MPRRKLGWLLAIPFLLLAGNSLKLRGQDTRPATTLKLPPSSKSPVAATSKSPVVAEAAMKGDVATVRRLIQQGANVDVAQGDGMTALHWAADRGDTAIASALLRAKASVRATTRIGSYTPLHIAAKNGYGGIVKALLAAGSDPKAPTTSGATPLHFAAGSGDTVSVQALVAKGVDLNAKENEYGQTPLIFAAADGRAGTIRELLKAGADASQFTTVIGSNEFAAAEQAAARKRNAVLVSFEPEKHKDTTAAIAASQASASPPGAPPGILAGGGGAGPGGGGGGGGQGGAAARGPQPKGPFTPAQIQAAIDSGRAVMLSASATKGPVREEVDTINGGVAGFQSAVGGVGGLTALHHAVRQGNHDAVVALLDGGADINVRTKIDSTTPLLSAAINGQFDVAMTLVKRGADVNLASTHGNTPLFAVINSQWAMRSRFPQPQAVQNQKTPYLDLMEAILKAGAPVNTRIKTHLWYFAYNNCGNGNCGLENLEGATPFWRAAYSLDVDAMKLLLKYGADPNLPTQRNQQAAAAEQRQRAARAGPGGAGAGGAVPPGPPTDPAIDSAARAVVPGIGTYPIHSAAGVGYGNGFAGNSHRHVPDAWMPTMKFLVEELKADVNQRDAQGMTPLHHAAARGDNEMILYLVSKGADVKAVSRRGQTTVDLANGPVQRLRPFPETIELLEKLGAKNSHRCVGC
jgi:ankyrin repeat protein